MVTVMEIRNRADNKTALSMYQDMGEASSCLAKILSMKKASEVLDYNIYSLDERVWEQVLALVHGK